MNEIRNQPNEMPLWSEAVKSDSDLPMKSQRSLKGVCRCCLAEGNFETMELRTKQDPTISYIEMLRMVLGFKLIYIGHPRLICSTCAIQLRQACAFRKQVVSAERTFISCTQPQKDIKIEIDHAAQVKVEPDIGGEVVNDNNDVNFTEPSNITDKDLVFKTDVLHEDSDVQIIKPKVRKAKGTIPCHYCKIKFNTEAEKKEHLDKKHLMCLPCKRRFPTPQERIRHKELHPVQCTICDEIFKTPQLKRYHYKKVHGQKCAKCNERVKIADWYKHNKEMHGWCKYRCGICNRILKGMSALHLHHRQVHMKEKNVQCPQCDYMAFDNIMLKKHMDSHSTDKKFVCDYCNKGFIRKSTLRYHVMIHSRNKTKVCKLCGEAFVQRASLKYHLEKYHPGDFY